MQMQTSAQKSEPCTPTSIIKGENKCDYNIDTDHLLSLESSFAWRYFEKTHIKVLIAQPLLTSIQTNIFLLCRSDCSGDVATKVLLYEMFMIFCLPLTIYWVYTIKLIGFTTGGTTSLRGHVLE